MAQNQKSFKTKNRLKNLLVGASALAISLGSTSALATDFFTGKGVGAPAAVGIFPGAAGAATVNNGTGVDVNVLNAAGVLRNAAWALDDTFYMLNVQTITFSDAYTRVHSAAVVAPGNLLVNAGAADAYNGRVAIVNAATLNNLLLGGAGAGVTSDAARAAGAITVDAFGNGGGSIVLGAAANAADDIVLLNLKNTLVNVGVIVSGATANATFSIKAGGGNAATYVLPGDLPTDGTIKFGFDFNNLASTVVLNTKDFVVDQPLQSTGAGGVNGIVIVAADTTFRGVVFTPAGAANGFAQLRVNDGVMATIDTKLENVNNVILGTLAAAVPAAGHAANSNTGCGVIINDGKGVAVPIDGIAPAVVVAAGNVSFGIVRFLGDSVVTKSLGNANVLNTVVFEGGAGKIVDFQIAGGAGVIKASNIKFTGDATMRLSTASQTVITHDAAGVNPTGAITTENVGQGNIVAAGGFNHVIKGNIGAAAKDAYTYIGDIQVQGAAANTLAIQAANGVNGLVAVDTISSDIAANVAGSGLKIQSTGAAIVDLYVKTGLKDGANRANVILAGDVAGPGAASTYNLKKGSTLVANYLDFSTAANQILNLEDGVTVDANNIGNLANHDHGIIKLDKTATFATIRGNIGADYAGANTGNGLDQIQFSGDAAAKSQTLTLSRTEGQRKDAAEALQIIDLNAGIDFALKAHTLVLTDKTTISKLANANNATVQVNGFKDNQVVTINTDGAVAAVNGLVLGNLKVTSGVANLAPAAAADHYVRNVTVGSAGFRLTPIAAVATEFKNMAIVVDGDSTLEIAADGVASSVKLGEKTTLKNATVADDGSVALKIIKFIGDAVNNSPAWIVDSKANGGEALKLTLENGISSFAADGKTFADGKGNLTFSNGKANIISGGSLGDADTKRLGALALDNDGDNKTSLEISNAYFKDAVTLADNSGLVLSGTEYVFSSVVSKNVPVDATKGGVLRLTNTGDTTVKFKDTTAAAKSLQLIEIAGGNVTMSHAANAANTANAIQSKNIRFTNAAVASTVTLPTGFGLEGVTITNLDKTAKDSAAHGIAVVETKQYNLTNIGGDKQYDLTVGTTVDSTFNVDKTVYATVVGEKAIVTFAAGTGKSNAAIGTKDSSVALVTFIDEDLINMRSIYAQKATLAFAGKTVTLIGDNKIDAFEIGDSGVLLKDAKNIGAMVATANAATLKFAGNSSQKGDVGAADKRFKTISSDAKGSLELGGNYYTSTDIKLNNNVTLVDNLTLDSGKGSTSLSGDSLDLKNNTLKFAANTSAQDNFSYTEIITDYEKARIMFGNGVTTDPNNKVKVVIKDSSKVTGLVPFVTFASEGDLDNAVQWAVSDASSNRYFTYELVRGTGDGTKEKPTLKTTTYINLVDKTQTEAPKDIKAITGNSLSDATSANIALLPIDSVKNFAKLPDVAKAVVDALVVGMGDPEKNQNIIDTTMTLGGDFSTRLSVATAPAAGDEDARLAFGAWVDGIYAISSQKTNGNYIGYRANTFGGRIGFDGAIDDDAMVGLAVTLAGTKVKHNTFGEANVLGKDHKTDITHLMFALYGSYNLTDQAFVQASFSFGNNEIKGKRSAITGTNQDATTGAVTSLVETVKTDYSATSLTGKVMFGYNVKVSDMTFTPTVGIRANGYFADAYKETGATSAVFAAKRFDKVSTGSLDGIIGAKIEYAVNTGEVVLTPELHGSMSYKLLGGKVKDNAYFVANPDSVLAKEKSDNSKFLANLGAGLSVDATDMIKTAIVVDGFMNSTKYSAVQATVTVRVRF